MSTVPMIFPDDSPRARRSDPLTSHRAADITRGYGAKTAVLSWLSIHKDGLTDDEIASKHIRSTRRSGTKALSGSRLRTARSELVRDKQVIAAGEGTSDAGNPAQIWRLAP